MATQVWEQEILPTEDLASLFPVYALWLNQTLQQAQTQPELVISSTRLLKIRAYLCLLFPLVTYNPRNPTSPQDECPCLVTKWYCSGTCLSCNVYVSPALPSKPTEKYFGQVLILLWDTCLRHNLDWEETEASSLPGITLAPEGTTITRQLLIWTVIKYLTSFLNMDKSIQAKSNLGGV